MNILQVTRNLHSGIDFNCQLKLLLTNDLFITQGYRQCKAFLVGPGPMESTLNDFWRMIWEKQSFAIVMLGQLVENGEVTKHVIMVNLVSKVQ